MANSEIASYVVWVLVLAISFYLFARNKNYDRWNALFIITFSFVQFLEAGMWHYLNTGDAEALSLMTSVVLVALWVQPFVQSYAGYYYVSKANEKASLSKSHAPPKFARTWQEIVLLIMAIVYVGLVAYAIVRAFDPEVLGVPRNQRVRTTVGANGHLVYVDESAKSKGGSFINGGIALLTVLYLIGLFFPLFFAGWRGLTLVAVGLASLGIAYWTADQGEVFSFWMVLLLVYSVIALFL